MKTIEFPKKPDSENDVLAQFIGTPYEAEAREIYENARQEADQEIRDASSKAERTRIIGLLRAFVGPEQCERFEAILQAGLSLNQFRNIRDALGENEMFQGLRLVATNTSGEVSALKQVRDGLLKDLEQSSNVYENDFMDAVATIQAKRRCSKTSAMQEVARRQPGLHREFIQSFNPGIKVDFS